MNEYLKKFSIGDIELYKNDDNVDFAIAELYFICSGSNGQDSPIPDEVVKRDAHTVLGKPIVVYFDGEDATTHDFRENIVGWVPSDSTVRFVEKNNRIYAVVDGVISKIYATQIVEMMKNGNYRSVSCEFSCNQDDESHDGTGIINAFDIRGITILGKDVLPACPEANIQIKKFSLENANKYYKKYNKSFLKQFADERKKEIEDGKTYKVNKTELKDTDWGSVDKASMRDKIMKAKNKDSLVHEVYAQVEADWENAPSSNLKYPLMQLVGDTFYYNRGALSSALAYSKQHNDSDVTNKVESLYKKFKLDNDKEDTKKMAEKEFEIEGREAWGDVIKEIQSHEGKDAYVESVEKDHIIYKKGNTRYVVKADVQVGKDDKKVSAKIDWGTSKKDADQKEFAEKDGGKETEDKEKEHDSDEKAEEFADKEDKKSENKEKDKKFSLNQYADNGAYLEMLEKETEENKKLAGELLASDDMNVIMSKVFELNTKCNSLQEFKDNTLKAQADKQLCGVLSDVKGNIPEEDYNKFAEEAKTCKFDDVEQFSMKVKAFAFEMNKNKKDHKSDDGVMRFSFDKFINGSKNETDVFNKILNK
jgi:hypothetical protein